MTYNPFLCHLGQTIRKNLFLLYQDEEVKLVFTPAPFVSICTANHRFTCSGKCFVYLPLYKVCGWQYTGENINEFRYRWNNYKDHNRKSLRGDEHKQAGFFAHFQNLDHNGFLEDTEVTFTYKTDPSDSARREKF